MTFARILAILVAGLVSFAAFANPYGYYSQPNYGFSDNYYPSWGSPRHFPREQQLDPEPVRIIKQGIELLKRHIDQPGQGDTAAFIESQIAPYFDFAYMAEWAGGAGFKMLDNGQKRDYANKLKSQFLSALTRNLGGFSRVPPRIDVFPSRGNTAQNEYRVTTRVLRHNGRALKLEFRFYRGKAGWKIFDVTANGTSAVAYYRKMFNRMMNAGSARPY